MAQSPQRFRGKPASARVAEPTHAALGDQAASEALERIAAALERLAPSPPPKPDFAGAEAFVWHPEGRRLAFVSDRDGQSDLYVIEVAPAGPDARRSPRGSPGPR